MSGKKIVLITGANSGIGKGTAIALARANFRVLMLCRNWERSEPVRQEIMRKTRNLDIELFIADLADLAQVQQIALEINQKHPRIDVLVNNAGVIHVSKQLAYGIERTFVVNYLSHYLLTYLLMSSLLQSSDPRVINLSSLVHPLYKDGFTDLNYEQHPYGVMDAYSRSKLAMVLFTYKLASLQDSLSVNAVDPGIVGTNFTKNNGWYARIGMTLFKPFARSIHRAGKLIAYLAKENAGSGNYYRDKTTLPLFRSKIHTIPSSPASYDLKLQEKLWTVSQGIIRNVLDLDIPKAWNVLAHSPVQSHKFRIEEMDF